MAIQPRPEHSGNNFYIDVFNRVFNIMRQSTLRGDERHHLLSETVMDHIYFDSIDKKQANEVRESAIYISEDVSTDVTEQIRNKIVGEIVEDFRVRIDLVLPPVTGSEHLIEAKTDLMMDMRQLLTPENFVNIDFSYGARITDTRIVRYGQHPDSINSERKVLVYIFELQLHHFRKNLNDRDVSAR